MGRGRARVSAATYRRRTSARPGLSFAILHELNPDLVVGSPLHPAAAARGAVEAQRQDQLVRQTIGVSDRELSALRGRIPQLAWPRRRTVIKVDKGWIGNGS